MDADVAARYELARRVAADAAQLTLSYFQQDVRVVRKADESPVTIADQQAEEQIRGEVLRKFPEDGFLGEEGGAVEGSSPYRWIVDPIDGTKSFISGVPLFGTMVAVEHAGRGIIGVLAFPALGVSIDAAAGQGAWETRRDGSRIQARVAPHTRLADGLLVTTDWEGFVERGAEQGLLKLGQAAWYTRTWGDCYGYYLVATGRALAMIDPRLNIWDAAALQPILEEAGGTFSDWKGRSTLAGGEAIGTNGNVLEEVLAVTRGCP